jgi:serine/threonine-protein kinase
MLGTACYMAPEQFRDARAVDVRADIYSFGVVLFEMLASRLPFRGDTLAMLDRQHSRYDPPSVVPSIPKRYERAAERLDAIVRRCLEKDPADRFASIAALRQALIRALRRLGGEYDPRP